jgi:hypothetical protein
MLGIDLALVRGDDEDEADALRGQPVMQMVQIPGPGLDLPLAEKPEARMLLDVVAPVEPVVLAQQRTRLPPPGRRTAKFSRLAAASR